MSQVSFLLANEAFTLGTSIGDSERRRRYYRDGSQQLTMEEKRILKSLGIDEEMESTLAPYMPSFFDLLPKCNTDTNVLLSKDCEIPYYVIWSTLFANRASTETRIKINKNQKTPRTLFDVAQNSAFISELRTTEKQNNFHAVFTLIPIHPETPSIPAEYIQAKPISEILDELTKPNIENNSKTIKTSEPKSSANRLFTLIPKP